MLKKYKGIIFDVDGVIVNSEPIHFKAYQKILEKYNVKLSEKNYKKWFAGKSIQGGISTFLKNYKLNLTTDKDSFIREIVKLKKRLTADLYNYELHFFPDTLEFIEIIKLGNLNLKGVGILTDNPKLALATGAAREILRIILNANKTLDIFKIKVVPEDYIHSKPNPESYLLALKRMNLDPNEVIGIEDSIPGIKALNNANIFSIGITTTHMRDELNEAKLVVNSLMDLLKN